jgi:hypothetical protein
MMALRMEVSALLFVGLFLIVSYPDPQRIAYSP